MPLGAFYFIVILLDRIHALSVVRCPLFDVWCLTLKFASTRIGIDDGSAFDTDGFVTVDDDDIVVVKFN